MIAKNSWAKIMFYYTKDDEIRQYCCNSNLVRILSHNRDRVDKLTIGSQGLYNKGTADRLDALLCGLIM